MPSTFNVHHIASSQRQKPALSLCSKQSSMLFIRRQTRLVVLPSKKPTGLSDGYNQYNTSAMIRSAVL